MKLNRKSIRFKIPFYLFVFVIVMLLLLWIMEIFLLDSIYKSIKTDAILNAGNYISDNITNPDIGEYINQLAITNDVCIAVADEKGTPIYWSSSSSQCVREITTTNRFMERISLAYQNDNTYVQEVQTTEYIEDIKLDIPISIRSYNEIQYTHIIEGASNYYLFMNSTISPINATVDTLKTILTIVTISMSIIAILLGLYISRKIIAPIRQLNTSAKKLGKEDVHFSGKGYLEIEELSSTLNQANKDLHQVEKLRNELISNISHDLRTPLTMISGYAEMMRDLPDENNEENLNVIINETKYLSRLVNDVLDLSKLQAGAQKLEEKRFDLTQMLLDMIERVRSLSDIQIDFIYDKHFDVIADEMKISQVFYNILNNAIHYTKDKVIVRQILKKDTIRIEIQDFGEGIEETEIDKIWQCYYRSANHSRQISGSGLGLYICKQILDLHHATYGVTSKLHEGSTFYFELNMKKDVASS